MALLFIDSFDHYASGDLGEKHNQAGGTIATGVGRCGTDAWRAGTPTIPVSKTLTHPAPTGSTAIVGVARQYNSQAASFGVILEIGNSVDLTIRLLQNIDGTLSVTRNVSPATTLVGPTTTFSVQAGIWYYFELKVLLSATVGTIDVRVNGVAIPELSASGIDTIGTQSTVWSTVGLRNLSGSPPNTYYDDWYVCDGSGAGPDNDFLGDTHVTAVLAQTDAVAAGFHQDWSLSSGLDHGALVDDSPPDDDTTYIFSGTAAQQDTFNIPDIKLVSGTVFGVQNNLTARKDDVGERRIRSLVRSGGTTDVHATDRPVSSDTYMNYHTIYRVNPVTAAAWTIAGVNAAEFGVRLQS